MIQNYLPLKRIETQLPVAGSLNPVNAGKIRVKTARFQRKEKRVLSVVLRYSEASGPSFSGVIGIGGRYPEL